YAKKQRGVEQMEKLEIGFKSAVAVLGGIGSYLFGGWNTLLEILVIFVILDYITGIVAAGYNGELSSKIGYKGILKKVMIFVIVAVANLVDGAIGDAHIIRDATICFYIANELLSTLENAGNTGIPIPEKLKNAVEVLKGRGDGK